MSIEENVVETQETPIAPEEPVEATREELIEAAQLAAKAEEAPAAPAEAAPPAEEEPKWQRLVKAREEAQKERETARSQADEWKRKAEEEAKLIVEQARKQAQEEVAAERARWKTRFQTDPEGALGELGDGEAVASKILDLNTPHGKAIAKMQAELQEAKQVANEAKSVRDEFESFKRQQAEHAERSQYETAKSAFLSNHATSEKTPYLMARYDTDEMVARASQIAREWGEAKLKFDLDDVAQYLEAEAKKRLSALGLQPAQQSGAGASSKTPGVAPKSAANGERTISAASSSERRASPKPFHEMTPAEQREDLMAEVRKVWRATGKT